MRRGARDTLTAKTLRLPGGPASMTPQPGHSPAATIFLGDDADALLHYCGGTDASAREVPGLVSIPVPDAIEVGPLYGAGALSTRPEAAELAPSMLSETGQAIPTRAGLLPPIAAAA